MLERRGIHVNIEQDWTKASCGSSLKMKSPKGRRMLEGDLRKGKLYNYRMCGMDRLKRYEGGDMYRVKSAFDIDVSDGK